MPRSPRRMRPPATKIAWSGRLISVQPRIRLNRSFDQRTHTYQGYVLRVNGTIGDEQREFIVAIGKGAQAKHAFAVGDTVSGAGVPVADPRLETAELYKVSKLKVLARAAKESGTPPPWHGPTTPSSRRPASTHRPRDTRPPPTGIRRGAIWWADARPPPGPPATR